MMEICLLMCDICLMMCLAMSWHTRCWFTRGTYVSWCLLYIDIDSQEGDICLMMCLAMSLQTIYWFTRGTYVLMCLMYRYWFTRGRYITIMSTMPFIDWHCAHKSMTYEHNAITITLYKASLEWLLSTMSFIDLWALWAQWFEWLLSTTPLQTWLYTKRH